MSIGKKLRSLRDKSGLTQEELARLVGVRSLAISRYELDKMMPSGEMVFRLADALGAQAQDLRPDELEGAPVEHRDDVGALPAAVVEFLRSGRLAPINEDELVALVGFASGLGPAYKGGVTLDRLERSLQAYRAGAEPEQPTVTPDPKMQAQLAGKGIVPLPRKKKR